MELQISRVAEILRDIQYTYQYESVWAEVNDDGSLTFLAINDHFDEEYLFGSRPDNLDINYAHFRRNIK
jgi:hypothetical protein